MHPGVAASMPNKPSSAEIAGTVVEQWSKDSAGQPGFRKGQSISPGKAQGTLEVSSFLQVPSILKALENGDSLRLKFPEPAPGTPDADTIRAEQKEIREFIKSKASMKFSDIQGELAGKIEGSLEFSKFPKGGLTGADWIKAHGLDSAAGSLTLNVASVYRGDAAVAGGQVELDSLMVKLREHITEKNGSKAILTVEARNATELAGAILSRLNNLTDKPKGLANITVWVGASNDPFSGQKVKQDECNALVSMPLDEFLKRYSKAKGTQETAEESLNPSNKDADKVVQPQVVKVTPWPSQVEEFQQQYFAA
jgi:hypothetical protein